MDGHGRGAGSRRACLSWMTRRPLRLIAVFLIGIFILTVRLHQQNEAEAAQLRAEAEERDRPARELAEMIRTYVPKGADVGLVFGKTRREDVKWVRDLIQENPNFKPFIYTADAEPEPGFLPPHSARGREVSAYLSYVVDYYEQLPAYSIFIHANEDQWHNDLFGPSTKAVLKSLRLEAVDAKGYVNLRCEFEPGCPTSIHPHNPTPHDIETKDTRAYVAQIYMDLFAVPLQQVPDHLGAICCAQFAVSRDRIRQRPKSDYQRMLNWVDGPSAEIVDSFGVGWVFESLWHVVFGMDSINCPETLQCRCDNYGWCGPLASGQTLTAVRKKTK